MTKAGSLLQKYEHILLQGHVEYTQPLKRPALVAKVHDMAIDPARGVTQRSEFEKPLALFPMIVPGYTGSDDFGIVVDSRDFANEDELKQFVLKQFRELYPGAAFIPTVNGRVTDKRFLAYDPNDRESAQ